MSFSDQQSIVEINTTEVQSIDNFEKTQPVQDTMKLQCAN